MDFGIIYNELNVFQGCRILQTHYDDADLLLKDLVLTGTDDHDFVPDLLYVFSAPPIHPVKNFVLIQDHEELLPLDSFDSSNFIVVMPDGHSENTVQDFLLKLFEDDKRLNADIQPLYNVLLNGRGLQALSNTASTILGNPFWIIDLNYNFVTKPTGPITDKNIQKEIQTGYVLDHTVEVLRRNKLRDQLQKINKAILFSVHDSPKRMIMAQVTIKDITVAYINAFEENKEFTSYDLRIMNKIASIISVEMQKDTYFRDNKGMIFSYLITDILDETPQRTYDAKTRLKTLGYTTLTYFQVLTLRILGMHGDDSRLTVFNTYIKQLFPNSIYTIYKNQSVFIITSDTPVVSTSAAIEKLADYSSSTDYTVVISAPFKEFQLVKDHYLKNNYSLSLISKYGLPGKVFFNEDLIMLNLLNKIYPDYQYYDFAHGALKKLIENDSIYGSELAKSMQVFLQNNMLYSAASKVLHVHENTLRHRIDHAKRIAGLTLSNGVEVMELLLSYALYEHNQKFDSFS